MKTATPRGVARMGMENYTKHQQGIIKRYYENIDQITLQKLSELVTELYLAEGKKRDKMWATATGHMEKLGVPKDRVTHILAKKDAALLAALVNELMGKK
jgi:hypothetical protein